MNKRRKIALGSVITCVILLVVSFVWFISVIHHTDHEKQQRSLQSDQAVVIMFYSHTCPDCKEVASVVNRSYWEGEFKDNYLNIGNGKEHSAVFVDYKNEKDQALFSQYHIESTPTFIVVKNGEVQQLAEKNGVPVMKYGGKNPKQIKRLYTDLSIDPNLN